MNIVEISNKFPTEHEAVLFAEKIRWGKKPKCTYCTSVKVSKRTKDMRYKCYDCNKTFSVTVGTQIHDTRLPVKTWLFALSLITDAKKGLSARQLQRNLSISYPTAHKMYMQIRRWMVTENSTNPELDGIVEMDTAYIGGKPRKQKNYDCIPQKKVAKLDERIKELKEAGVNFKGKRGSVKCTPSKRGKGTKNIPITGIVERNGNVFAEITKTLNAEKVKQLVKKYVKEDDAVIVTDEDTAHNKLHKIIEHVAIDHKRMYSYKGVNTNSIESFWAIIKRGIIGQYHKISPKNLPEYIAEFVFKYNNRKDDDVMFETLVRNALQNKN